MTERGRATLERDADFFAVGPSALSWDGDALTIDIDEVTAPIPSRMRGTVKLYPNALLGTRYPLDAAGRHIWRPVATRAFVTADFPGRGIGWRGEGYFDSNFGVEPLEDGFSEWQWSRAHLKDRTAVLYEGTRRDGTPFALGLGFDHAGGVAELEPLPPARLGRTGWLMPRRTRAHGDVAVRKTWEDAPFYARSMLATHLYGEAVDAVHESLSLDRLRSPVVKAMLPFRMPRRSG